jgi:hypothetical protein
VFGAGGASTSAECMEWAKQVGLPVVLDLGMTEVGGMIDHIARYQYITDCLTLSSGPLFHSDIKITSRCVPSLSMHVVFNCLFR